MKKFCKVLVLQEQKSNRKSNVRIIKWKYIHDIEGMEACYDNNVNNNLSFLDDCVACCTQVHVVWWYYIIANNQQQVYR